MSQWLLVEDEPDMYDLLCELYTALGSQPIAHMTGEDALAWLEGLPLDLAFGTEGLPVFALIDIRLPGDVSGIDVASALRQNPLTQGVPIVLMTAYRLSPLQEREVMARSGAHKLLYKPLPSFSELHRIFAELTG